MKNTRARFDRMSTNRISRLLKDYVFSVKNLNRLEVKRMEMMVRSLNLARMP